MPYDPRCTICARGKSTFQHRRRREGALETEVQADFGFLTTCGELVEDETDGTIKILALTELSTNCVGYVVVGQEARSVKSLIQKWFRPLRSCVIDFVGSPALLMPSVQFLN